MGVSEVSSTERKDTLEIGGGFPGISNRLLLLFRMQVFGVNHSIPGMLGFSEPAPVFFALE